jgi:hypothetical protein
MIKAMRVENTVVCFIQGKMYQKVFTSDEDILNVFELALNTDETNEAEVTALKTVMLDAGVLAKEQEDKDAAIKMQEEIDAQKVLINWLDDIRQNGHEHFELDGFKLYLKGINITIPEFLAAEFAQRSGEDLESLINFWRLLALNPDPRCREDLYKFLINNKLSVTPSGYFVAYRNAEIKNAVNQELNEFVSEAWLKIKSMKKGPKNYLVVFNNELDEYEVMTQARYEDVCDNTYVAYDDDEEEYDADLYDNFVGNLQDLYLSYVNASSEEKTIYTDSYSRTTTIIVGEPVRVERRDCDANPDRTCSKGLHSANSSWLQKGYFGTVGLAVLIDPRNVIAVPYTDGGKLRCCEYLPIGVIEYDDNDNIIPIDSATFEYEYSTFTQQELENLLKTAEFEELKSHDIIPKELSFSALREIAISTEEKLSKMNSVIQSRVKNYGE